MDNLEKTTEIFKIEDYGLSNLYYTGATKEDFDSFDEETLSKMKKAIAIAIGQKKSRLNHQEFKFFMDHATNSTPEEHHQILELLGRNLNQRHPNLFDKSYYFDAHRKCKHLEKEADILMRNSYFESIKDSQFEMHFAQHAVEFVSIAHLTSKTGKDVPIVSESLYTITVNATPFVIAQRTRKEMEIITKSFQELFASYNGKSSEEETKGFFKKLFGKN